MLARGSFFRGTMHGQRGQCHKLLLRWYPHPREQQVFGIPHSLLLTASDSWPRAGQKVPDTEPRVHGIPGGANFKDQLKRWRGKKNPQPKPAPPCAPEEYRGRKGWMKEQGLSISLVRGVPIFNLRRSLTPSDPDTRGKTYCSPISPLITGT